ncbi:hypothetical protein SAMN02910298_02398 [Pseudobutyrivibrio sp. YE44]|uniref:hypothetical protein n=1 Tax=Pseudobutyrivibrio sp. YE44 TaxID=1520802 RepID=UPI0008877EF1|nr:hypothetical protein [Pseudobutyrivibrio sp. YE44]SDB47879.1 hypothetical protein SAMN02910298_02398 [Pseudobutyrivibrio sp. YE44]
MSNKLIKEPKREEPKRKKNRLAPKYYQGMVVPITIFHIIVGVIAIIDYFFGDWDVLQTMVIWYPLLCAFRVMSFKNFWEFSNSVSDHHGLISIAGVVAVIANFSILFKFSLAMDVEGGTNRLLFVIFATVCLYILASLFRIYVVKVKNRYIDDFFDAVWLVLIIGVICVGISSVGVGMVFTDGRPTTETVKVIERDKSVHHSRRSSSITYSVEIRHDNGDAENFQVSRNVWKNVEYGEPASIKTYDCIFGYKIRKLEVED